MAEKGVGRRIRTLTLVAITALLLPAAAALAQAGRYDGQPIRELEFTGLETLTAETMEHYLLGPKRDEEERRLDLEKLNERVGTLWERKLIDDVAVEVEPVSGGVKLIVRIVERPILVSVDYVGIKRVNRGDIIEQADRERISVYESQPLELGELKRLKLAIEELYKEKGYRFAEVSYTLEETVPGQRRAIYTIDEGDKVKIGDIDFDGNTVYGDWRLRMAMKGTKQSGIISKFTKKDIYNPAKIEEDLDKVRDLYRKAGYKDVLIARPELAVKAKNPGAATIKQQKRRLAITIPIEEGDRWRFGEITIEGNEVFSDELLLRQFESPRGGWLRSKVLDDAVESIGNLYSSVGYIFSKVETEVVEQGDNVANVVVKIDEADQFKVGRIEFEGNRKTRDKVLRRELMVQEGTVMNMTAVQNSLLKIRQLNYFALNEEEPVKFDFDGEDKTVDLVVQGEEAERTELQFGGGWSEFDGFFGQFAMRTTNFLGRGETVGVSVQSGRQRDLYDLEYRIPWFLDKPQSVGVRLFNSTLDSQVLTGVDFRQANSGISLSYGRSFRGFNSFSITYAFTDVEDFRRLFGAGIDGEDLTQEFNFRSSSLRPFWARNTLDSRFEPSRGMRLTGSFEVAGSFLGGDTGFIRPLFDFTWFKPVTRKNLKSSFGVQLDLGYITSIEDSDAIGVDDTGLFPQQRFFLGGDNSIRGFRRRSIVVREEDGTIRRDQFGFPLGGTKMLRLSAEYHLILGGPFRVVFYGDAGGVFDDDQNPDFGLMRYSAGAELRIQVPLFPAPLRFIYASNLDPLDADQFDSFDFSLSTSF
ncbi:MAG: outer membrane protein assembly factor BamA [bacterium]|nr:outer membrane protein assembly factor BamA [bacterium]